MTEGRLAYGLEHDGRRYIDTTELLRVYGAFDVPSQSVVTEPSHSVTPSSDELAQVIATAVAQAVEPLRAEIEKLRETLLRIEYKPDRDDEPQPPITEADDPWGDIFNSLKNRR
jgi:hypothetical protein